MVHWKAMSSGGKVAEYIIDKKGVDLVRPALLSEITPDLPLYMQSVRKKNEFYPTSFHPKVSWDTVQELHRTGRIYIANTWESKQ